MVSSWVPGSSGSSQKGSNAAEVTGGFRCQWIANLFPKSSLGGERALVSAMETGMVRDTGFEPVIRLFNPMNSGDLAKNAYYMGVTSIHVLLVIHEYVAKLLPIRL